MITPKYHYSTWLSCHRDIKGSKDWLQHRVARVEHSSLSPRHNGSHFDWLVGYVFCEKLEQDLLVEFHLTFGVPLTFDQITLDE